MFKHRKGIRRVEKREAGVPGRRKGRVEKRTRLMGGGRTIVTEGEAREARSTRRLGSGLQNLNLTLEHMRHR